MRSVARSIHRSAVWAPALAVSLGVAVAQAGEPAEQPLQQVVAYAGHLDHDGVPYDGTVQMRFRLFAAPEGGAPLWEEEHPEVRVFGGQFSVRLGGPAGGQAVPIGPHLSRNRQHYLETSVRLPAAPDAEPTPWVPLTGRRALHPSGQALWSLETMAVPRGAVMYFDLPECPPGYRPFAPGNGRYVVGVHPQGTLGGLAGQPLGDREDRPVGQHSHAASQDAHSHQVNDPGHVHRVGTSNSDDCCGSVDWGNRHNAHEVISDRAWTGITLGGAQPAVHVQAAGAVPGTNAPYVQLRMCVKD